MSRTLINFWLDVFLMCSFVTLLWAVIVLRVAFPPGTAAAGWLLWGFTYDQWFELQFVLVCVFAFSALVHVMLHWTWVCGVITSRLIRKADQKKRQWTDGERTLVGVGLLFVLLNVIGIGLFAAMLTIQGPS